MDLFVDWKINLFFSMKRNVIVNELKLLSIYWEVNLGVLLRIVQVDRGIFVTAMMQLVHFSQETTNSVAILSPAC